MKKKIGIGIVAFLIIAQFFRIDKENPAVIAENDFIVAEKVDPKVAHLLKASCYDCHSNESAYPWYTNIAPVSWWVKNHINEGREELNFSDWSEYSDRRKHHKLEECIELIEEGEMPLSTYTLMHGDAKLDDAQQQLLINFFQSEMKKFEGESN